MSKYSLLSILEGMSNAEFEAAKEQDRLEAHLDRDKIKQIQALLRNEKNIKEVRVDEEASNRIEGLLNMPMKRQFLNSFVNLYMDILKDNEVDSEDMINHLNKEMHNSISHLKSNDEMGDDEREDFYNDSDSIY